MCTKILEHSGLLCIVQIMKFCFFNSFGIEHIPLEIKKFINHKNIKTNIFRLQAYNSIMCGYCCIKFIDFMLKDKSLFEFTSFFSPYDFKKNDDTILSYFK